MENNQYILRVNDLKTEFSVDKKCVHAVNGVTFDLPRGKTLCVVGESGCGKSQTAHSILQLLAFNGYIAGGTVEYIPDENGEPIELTAMDRNSKEIRSIRGKEISMIFQDPMTSLNPVYTVGYQIEEMLRHHEKISKKEARVRIVKLLEELGIPNADIRYDQYPHEFSGGMKQRVMIAMALVCNPKILIADEPTTALDVTIQAQILDLIRRMQKEYGTSVIFMRLPLCTWVVLWNGVLPKKFLQILSILTRRH